VRRRTLGTLSAYAQDGEAASRTRAARVSNLILHVARQWPRHIASPSAKHASARADGRACAKVPGSTTVASFLFSYLRYAPVRAMAGRKGGTVVHDAPVAWHGPRGAGREQRRQSSPFHLAHCFRNPTRPAACKEE
jgi:hypothetical protein